MDVYLAVFFRSPSPTSEKVNVHFLKHQRVCEVADALDEIVLTRNEYFLHPSGAHANNSDCSVNTVHYKPNPDRLEKMAKHEAVK